MQQNLDEFLRSQTDPKKRITFTVPQFDEFGELLHDRLDAILYYIEETTHQFMLITNFFDRDPERIQKLVDSNAPSYESLVYGGTLRQREILEEKPPFQFLKKLGVEKEINQKEWQAHPNAISITFDGVRVDLDAWRKSRSANWTALQHRQMEEDTKGVETWGVFDQFRKDELGLEDIKIGSLKEYFEGVQNILKENELPIIGDYFDIQQDLYIGIPLLGAGKFQGIVWIIFKAEERARYEDPERQKRLIKMFALEYNNLLMSWDVSKQAIFERAIQEVDLSNQIQKDCRVEEYYAIQTKYHGARIRSIDEGLNEAKAQAQKLRDQLELTATITILLDSFAHNISAHSLTALSWWFRERAEYLGLGKDILEALGRDINPLIRHSKLNPKQTLSKELFPLFKFLLEKGAFWSGITRQTNFAGKISNLYEVLWNDFINNPLYLGTIANTEEVLKLHIHLTIFEKEEPILEGKHFKNKKHIKKIDGVLMDGVFATINMLDFKLDVEKNRDSVFIEKNKENFELFKAALEQMKTFFPGGVVGKHAFFTLLENEIRNVKHFSGAVLKEIKETGLVLNITLHERPFDSQNAKPDAPSQFIKVGVCLKHPVNIDADLLVRRIANLQEDIITLDKSKPRLGGNFQDKICASLLLTNSFLRVQDKGSPMGKIYYPWIKTAAQKNRENLDAQVEFEVSHRRYDKITPEEFEQDFEGEKGLGYLKKYFHLWKGEDILDLEKGKSIQVADQENKSRYRFVFMSEPESADWNQLKAEGIIRLLSGAQKPQNIAEAYHLWLRSWLKAKDKKQDIVFDFFEGETQVGRLTYEAGKVRYENQSQIEIADEDDALYSNYKAIAQKSKIAVAHGSNLSKDPEKLNYRSDGELVRYFCKGKALKEAIISDNGEAVELLEALATRICIFDLRVFNRMYFGNASNEKSGITVPPQKLKIQEKRLELFRDNLFLDVQNETPDTWNSVKEAGFFKYNFLIVHLSFIENMRDAYGRQYGEERILDFINEQVLQGRAAKDVKDDFIFVVTTGRGRMLWWEKIKENPEYARFTTFRQIESILNVMEDALQISDDFNLKYNLVKLLFGS